MKRKQWVLLQRKFSAAEGRPAHNQQKKKEKKTNNSLHFIQSISLIEMKKELICLLIEEEKNEFMAAVEWFVLWVMSAGRTSFHFTHPINSPLIVFIPFPAN